MKDREAQTIIDNHADTIRPIIEGHGAPLGNLLATGALQRKHQASHMARLLIVLGDDAPGWRSKDDNPARRAIKRDVAAAMERLTGWPWEVRIAASYSCLAPQPDGSIERRDSAGRVIGVYA